MTNHKKLLAGLVAGLFVLAAASNASAGPPFSIAPFTLKVKSKIYTFNYPTSLGGTFFCLACYVPAAVSTTSNYPNGPLSGYVSGPVSVHVPSGTASSSYYAFNPYWGAQRSPGIPSTNATAGTNPAITQLPGAAILGANSPPDFTAATGQITATGTGYVPPGGVYLGTSSTFAATNGRFDVGHGKGPGTITYQAGVEGNNAGKVKYTAGTNQFGGTLQWLGQNNGVFRKPEEDCAIGAAACYNLLTFAFPVAPNAAGGVNVWTDSIDIFAVNTFITGSVTSMTTTFAGNGTTVFSTFPVTTGTVVVSQTQGSALTQITLTGSDTRTAAGVGNITLVTGWLGHTFTTSVSHWSGATTYKFAFGAAEAAPSLASPALGALGGLMAIAAVYVIRKRSTHS